MAPTVAVLGGGVAGLSAAHELAVRGFDVTVYEAGLTHPGTVRRSIAGLVDLGGNRWGR